MKSDDENELSKISKAYISYGPYLGLGVQLAATLVLFFYIGYWLDGKFETKPVFILIFSFSGLATGLYSFIKTVLELNKKQNDK